MKILILTGLEKSDLLTPSPPLVIPRPQIVQISKKSFKLSGFIKLIYENIENIEFFKDLIIEELQILKSPIISEVIEQNEEKIELPEFNREKQAKEGYSIVIKNNKVVLIAESEVGIFYGVQTLIQSLIKDNNGVYFPEMTVIDYPSFKIRAVSDDISRGQVPTVENVKKFIKNLSKFKINFFFIGYECDIFYYQSHPKLAVGRDALTREELLEIQDYAKKYFMEIVPLVTTTGHMDNILLLPEYKDMAEFPGAQCFDISNKRVRPFIKDILEEICDNFSSDYIHITCDELFDFGKYNSKVFLKNKGKEQALLEHYQFMFDILRKKGKKHILLYHDTILGYKALREKLPKDIIVFFWEYFIHFNFRHTKVFQKAGFPVIISPTVFSWTRNFPDIERGAHNTIAFVEHGYKRGVLGTAISSWGDFGNESFRDNRLYGYILSGAISWNTPGFDLNHFENGFIKHFLGSNDEKIIKTLHSLASVNGLISGFVAKLMAIPIFYALFWRHPFPSRKPKIKKKKMQKIIREMESAHKRIQEFKPFITKNKDYLNYLEIASNIGKFYAKKNLYTIKISKLLNQNPIPAKNKKEALNLIFELRTDLKNLKNKYQELWLHCAKPDGLQRLLPNYDWLDFIYQKKIEEIEANISWQNPFLESEWIGYPEKKIHQEYRYFRKKFSISNNKIKKAYLQGISNHYLKVFLNGAELGEVFSRFSLSIRPIDVRVKVFDITDFLQSENIIAVEAAYFANYIAAINVYIEIYYENGEKKIVKTDITWKTNKSIGNDWNEINFDDSQWAQAKSYGAPPKFNGEITRPYFLENKPSKTSYFFGGRGYFRIFTPSILLPVLNKFLKSIGA
ncbi:MAG: family 20 glycosylhydrolase [Candidatus Helarchaeota archaeon]